MKFVLLINVITANKNLILLNKTNVHQQLIEVAVVHITDYKVTFDININLTQVVNFTILAK